MKNMLFFCLLLILFAGAFSSCDKDPEVITNTVIETDTLFITNIDTVFITLTDTVTLTEMINDTATTFILLRHAETSGAGSNPNLSTEGVERTAELVRLLKNVSLDAVFSTNYNRTRQTAQPVADDLGLTVDIYDGFTLNPLIDGALVDYHGSAVLVVGHSNTTQDLLNILTGENTFPEIPETQYDNLYLVTVFEKGRSEVVHLKYGVETP
ncbi:MAG: hypothetical protein DHS20C18_35300 [Saprospiraceae bacterium]|nr:MAG: hypothetical protein DHS20C18_35300 [Saprospiraceae bacterium]